MLYLLLTYKYNNCMHITHYFKIHTFRLKRKIELAKSLKGQIHSAETAQKFSWGIKLYATVVPANQNEWSTNKWVYRKQLLFIDIREYI